MRKVALCIGNANFPESPLKNASNDANDVADHLGSIGFDVRRVIDASFAKMDAALKAFSCDLETANVGLFFYAGHGMQIGGVNFLTAVDSDFSSELDVKHSSLSLDKVIDVLDQGSNSTCIVLLDACRNNPYERRWRNRGPLGLAPMYAPRGTIIAYATSPGQTALDGDGPNGEFTAALLKHISTENVSIEELFKRVRNTLSASTLGKQMSWEHTSLMGDFYFRPMSLTGEMNTSYSAEALADGRFTCHGGRSLSPVLEGLRSHDWYSQNPAIKELKRMGQPDSSSNELFVLGRNLYQAKCGDSDEANKLFRSLRQNLNSWTEEIAFHVLNGVLFEIYFGPEGEYRRRLKGEGLEAVYYLEEDPEFESSFRFCRRALEPYQDSLFYMPLDLRDVAFDAVTEPVSKGCHRLTMLLFGGEDVLRLSDGEPLPAEKDKVVTPSLEVGKFEEKLTMDLGIPSRRLRVTYSTDMEIGDTILAPYDFMVSPPGA